MTEEWRPIAGYEGLYEVSNEGRVRSVDRVVPHAYSGTLTIRGRFMRTSRPHPATEHLSVCLCREGVARKFLVHRLVAEAFIPNPDDLPMVLHWDDKASNNHVENLRWGTQTENMADYVRNRGHHYGKRTHCKWGHEYTEANVTWVTYRKTTSRRCNTCDSTRAARKKVAA